MTLPNFDLFKWVPIISLIITVLGWTVSSYFSGRNTSRQAKRTELNKLIESIYTNLDSIYEEMITLVTEEKKAHEKTISYHKFIGYVANVKFICEMIRKLDKKQKEVGHLLSELRQACTDDNMYTPSRIGTALPRLRSLQEDFKKSFIKKF